MLDGWWFKKIWCRKSWQNVVFADILNSIEVALKSSTLNHRGISSQR